MAGVDMLLESALRNLTDALKEGDRDLTRIEIGPTTGFTGRAHCQHSVTTSNEVARRQAAQQQHDEAVLMVDRERFDSAARIELDGLVQNTHLKSAYESMSTAGFHIAYRAVSLVGAFLALPDSKKRELLWLLNLYAPEPEARDERRQSTLWKRACRTRKRNRRQ